MLQHVHLHVHVKSLCVIVEFCYIVYDAWCGTHHAKVSSVDLGLGDLGALALERVVVSNVFRLGFVQPLNHREDKTIIDRVNEMSLPRIPTSIFQR